MFKSLIILSVFLFLATNSFGQEQQNIIEKNSGGMDSDSALLKAKSELTAKTNETELLKNEIENQRKAFIAAIIFLLVVISYILTKYFKKSRELRKISEKLRVRSSELRVKGSDFGILWV